MWSKPSTSMQLSSSQQTRARRSHPKLTSPRRTRKQQTSQWLKTPRVALPPTTRPQKRTATDGTEGKPLRLPPGRHDGLEVTVVRGPRLPGRGDRGLEDPRLSDHPARGRGREPDRDRADT